MNIKILFGKVVKTLKYEGISALYKKTIKYIFRRKNVTTVSAGELRCFRDVLFINGSYLPHPARYRIDHQIEQLAANGLTASQVFFEDLTDDLAAYYRVFVVFRAEYDERVVSLVKKAKSYNKTVIYDIDDLIIDRKYTQDIPYIKSLPDIEREAYLSGVDSIQRMLRMCDHAVTTTEVLADKLKEFIPDVYINRNTASQEMVRLSLEAQGTKKKHSDVIIGYFSGSITHDDDMRMVITALSRIMDRYSNVRLMIAGEITVPRELKPFSDRLISVQFVDWRKLPGLIASVDINLIPLADTVFNAAKSENKWAEAALVKVPSVASRCGALKAMIEDQKTGLLVNNTEDEWFDAVSELIADADLRSRIADNAFRYVYKNCTTIYTGAGLARYIRSVSKPNIAFVLPSLAVSGGVNVALKHASVMQQHGYDVTIINEYYSFGKTEVESDSCVMPALASNEVSFLGSIDCCVATLWTTTRFAATYPAIKRRMYLVQGFETDFSPDGDPAKLQANATYSLNMEYVTVSRWCRNWLAERYFRQAAYIPNGIDPEIFRYTERSFTGRLRVLIEGNCDSENKNVDESFMIADQLDREHFEIWYVSSLGKPKPQYKYDRFFRQVDQKQMAEIYSQCHILLKSSIQESFSYPPLEMMATGGLTVVASNEGNAEYLVNGENTLLYELGNIEQAVENINILAKDMALVRHLIKNGLDTARQRSWKEIDNKIYDTYKLEEIV